MDKRGFIRTLEAVIAIILVFVFMYVISKSGEFNGSRNIDKMKSIQEGVLRGISNDEYKRDCVVSVEESYLEKDLAKIENLPPEGSCVRDVVDYVMKTMPDRFKKRYAFVICDMNNCNIPELPEENVYTSAVLISSSLKEGYGPKVVRLWVW